jgi:hypothetical protein
VPREVTLFTDDGHWAAVAQAWHGRILFFQSTGVRVSVFRVNVADAPHRGPWSTLRISGPWVQEPTLRGPWEAIGKPDWVPTPATSIEIECRFLGRGGEGEVVQERRSERVPELDLTHSGFGGTPSLPDDSGRRVVIAGLRSRVTVVVDGTTLTADVSTFD